MGKNENIHVLIFFHRYSTRSTRAHSTPAGYLTAKLNTEVDRVTFSSPVDIPTAIATWLSLHWILDIKYRGNIRKTISFLEG